MIPDVYSRHRQPAVDACQRSPDPLSFVISALPDSTRISDFSAEDELEVDTYRNRFMLVHEPDPILLTAITQRLKPTSRGVQTALVTGLSGTVVTTDPNHRVKVQFHWQRGRSLNPGVASPAASVFPLPNGTVNAKRLRKFSFSR